MGQRTQIFIRTKDLEGNIRNYYFHEQWGYGKGLLNRLISLMLYKSFIGSKYYFDEPFDLREFFRGDFDLFKEDKSFDNPEISIYEIEEFPIDKLISDLKSQDNNDGYMIINMESDEYPYDFSDVCVGLYDHDLNYISYEDYLRGYDIKESYINFVKAFVSCAEDGIEEGEEGLFVDLLKEWKIKDRANKKLK